MSIADLGALRRVFRSVFANTLDSVDGVVFFVFIVMYDIPGLFVIEGEYRDAKGHAVGGFGL